MEKSLLFASSVIGFSILLVDTVFPSPSAAGNFTPWCQRSEENARQCGQYFKGEIQRWADDVDRQHERELERLDRLANPETCTTSVIGNTAYTSCY